MNNDITTYTLGSLLSWPDDIIRRNAISIMKRLQAIAQSEKESEECDCIQCTNAAGKTSIPF